MKKSFGFLGTMILILSLTACGGVSQAEYDKVVKERDALQEIVEQQLQDSIGDLRNNIHNTEPIAEPSPSPKAEASVPPSPQRVGLNETVASDELNITLLSCSSFEKIKDGNYRTYKANSGMIYVVAAFRIENISQDRIDIEIYTDFDYYADNLTCDTASLGVIPPRVGDYDPIYNHDPVNPGRMIEGYVACEIPAETKLLEIEFEGFIFEYSFE